MFLQSLEARLAGFQLAQQFRVAVEQAEKVDHGGHRLGLPTFITGKGIFAAPGQLRGFQFG